MPDTGGRREIASRVDAKEAETFQESKQLTTKTKQRSAISSEKDLARRKQERKGPQRRRKTTTSNS